MYIHPQLWLGRYRPCDVNEQNIGKGGGGKESVADSFSTAMRAGAPWSVQRLSSLTSKVVVCMFPQEPGRPLAGSHLGRR